MRIPEELVQYIMAEVVKRLGLTLAPASPAPRPAANRPAPTAPGKRPVITEAELIKLCPPSGGEGQQLRLPQGAIVTPLARDYIRAMKITLI